MRTIAVLNQKGGVGKTTTTVNTAAALAALGKRVAVIDLDPQAHLTIHLGVEPQNLSAGSYEVLTQSAGFEQSLMLIRPNLWLLGANINLVGAETELVSVVGREIILREAMLGSGEQFDFCLIDCAPSLGLLSLNALAAAQEVLIPLQPHFLALQGFGKLLQTIDLVNKRINRDLRVTGVVLCMFDTRASLPNEVRADIERFLENARGSDSAWSEAQLLPTFIRRNIKLAEAPSYGQTIVEYDPTCNGAVDYRNVARFFLGLTPELEGQDPSEPKVEVETESEIETEPQAIADETPSVETEPQEYHHEPEAATVSEPQPPIEDSGLPEPQYGVDNADGPESVTPPTDERPLQESWCEPQPTAPAGEGPVTEAPEPAHCDANPVDGFAPEPPIAQEQGESAPVEYANESEPPSQEMPQEPETPAQETPPEQPPFQIQAIHLPAPRTYSPRPLQDKPTQSELSPEPSPRQDDAPNTPQQSQDEPEQVGS